MLVKGAISRLFMHIQSIFSRWDIELETNHLGG
jgi:hypothetical protein